MNRLAFGALIASVLVSARSHAQSLGTIELLGFGRYSFMSSDRPLENGAGIGGGLGLFFSHRLKLVADVSYTPTSDVESGADAGYMPLHIRLGYELPLTAKVRALAAVGYNWNNYIDHLGDDQGWTVALGGLYELGARTRLFAQGTMDYAPANWNDYTVIVPNVTGPVKIIERGDIHYGIEAGISQLFGGRRARPAAIAVAPVRDTVPTPTATKASEPAPAPIPTPAPQRQPEPAPQPAPERFVELAPVYFDFDKSELRDDARSELDRAIAVLRANAGSRIRLEGHTDERGTSAYNLRLGERRAAAVRAYLSANGIDTSRLEVASKGEAEPADSTKDESAYSRNRRVVLLVPDGSRLRAPR